MSMNNNFQWRDNDNSMNTRLRYDLEAAHWIEAFERNMVRRQSGTDAFKFLYGLFLIASGLVTIAAFIVYVIVTFIFRLVVYLLRDKSGERNEEKKKE